ncbi:MAG TPA: cellulase family glycosylhydrolase [Chitinophagales bacterium]|nr:cellulase family glycosylhydrolase [Chitinophagales bacterium]
MKYKFLLTVILFSLSNHRDLFASTNAEKPKEQTTITQHLPSIKDQFGRTLILHGLNTASNAKHSKDNHPWIQEKDVIREDTEFCFNTVRYLVFWGAIEPQQGVYNYNYLNEVKKRVEWYTQNKIHVIIDMHQDVYGYGVGGNGAPDWASTQTKIQNLISDKQLRGGYKI